MFVANLYDYYDGVGGLTVNNFVYRYDHLVVEDGKLASMICILACCSIILALFSLYKK